MGTGGQNKKREGATPLGREVYIPGDRFKRILGLLEDFKVAGPVGAGRAPGLFKRRPGIRGNPGAGAHLEKSRPPPDRGPPGCGRDPD